MNLYEASNQWSTRPEDQRFWNLQELLEATRQHKESAREATVVINSLKLQTVGNDGADLELVGKTGTAARLTNWSFGQLSRMSGAPADYLRSLPASLVANNLNYGLQRLDGSGNLLLHKNGSLVARSLTSDKYSRIWNCDVVEKLMGFEEYGWRVPPARSVRRNQNGVRFATEADVLDNRDFGLSVRVGDLIAPAGLYASDHDTFVFMVNEKNRLYDGTQGGLSRGFFLTNSEVGAAALKITTFLYRGVCGNHICYNVENVNQLKIVHRGKANLRFNQELSVELVRYVEGSASKDEDKIRMAMNFSLGNNKEEVLDALFKNLRGDLPRKVIEAGYDQAEGDSDTDTTIDPRTVWGMVQGLSAHSQTIPYADERVKIDKAGGKILTMAF